MEVAKELEEGESLVRDNNIEPPSPYGVNYDSKKACLPPFFLMTQTQQ
jgi:hypothetical protein